MYKCDKCGCEHNSRTTCPKCGAPVVIVNEDYLLRRQQWEEQQKNNLRYKKKGESGAGSSKSLSSKSSTVIGNSDRDVADGKSKEQKSLKEHIEQLGISLSKKIRDVSSSTKESKDKKEKERNAEELKDKRRENAIKLRRRRVITVVAAVAMIALAVTAVFVGIHIYKGIDRSDVRYFDGHELVSVNDGLLFNVDREKGSYKLLTYNDSLNAFFLQGEEGLLGWYDGNEHIIEGNYGNVTDEHMFSESGRYLAYIMYDEAGELYSIILHDLRDGKSTVYPTDRRAKLIAVSDSGKVLFYEMDTTEYSTVINMELYAADMSEKLLLCDDVSEAVYIEGREYTAYISEGSLYICSISDAYFDNYDGIIPKNEHIFVNEGVINIAENMLGEDMSGDDTLGDEMLYITEEGLWVYEKGESRLAAQNVSGNCEVYYGGDGFLYYRNMNSLYFVGKGQKKGVPVLEGIQGDIVVSQSRSCMWVAGKDNKLYRAAGSFDIVEEDVSYCGRLYGGDGCTYLKEGKLICLYDNKQFELGTSNIKTDGSTVVISSKKYLYYVDSSNVLWKIAKNGSNRDSLGFTSLVGYSDINAGK